MKMRALVASLAVASVALMGAVVSARAADQWFMLGQQTIKSVDQDYLERAQALMEQVELRPRSQRSIDRQAW